jgi:Icc protein
MTALRLVQFTDTHLYGNTSESLRGVGTYPALAAALKSAQADIAAAQALLVTGDLVQDDPAGYAHFRALFAPLGKPVFCLPGNHDLPSKMQRELSQPPFQYCGSAEWVPWRVILLDSTLEDSAGGQLRATELQRLDAELTMAGDRHCLVCLHHHPVPMRSRWLDTVGLANAAEFFEVLDRHRNVRALLWGHVHQPLDAERAGVRLLATPSTCTQFMPLAADFAVDSRPPAYRTLSLAADGSIETQIKWIPRQWQ